VNQQHDSVVSYCSVHSNAAHEPLIGSASRTDYWILLEYPYPPSAKALQENQLPHEVNRYLAALQSTLPASRVLLIRKETSSPSSHPALYLADGRDGQAILYKIHINSFLDLLGLDIPAIFSDRTASQAFSCNEHLFLICTNGKRDACCSKWGLPLFNSLSKQYGEMVWQTSHVGGHRFAPNLVCLPHGIFYGRVPLDQASRLAGRYLNGLLTLDFFRGNAAYPPHAQAAEYFIRLDRREERMGSYHLESVSSIAENHWEIHFSNPHDRVNFRVVIEAIQTDKEIFESCSTPSERKVIKEFRLQQPIQEV